MVYSKYSKRNVPMIRNWLRNFMIGRYGPDQLYTASLITAFAFAVLSAVFSWWCFRVLSYLFLFYALFRLLSRNIQKRRRENDRFLKYWWPVRTWFIRKIRRLKSSRTYAFFKCPACKNTLRVPKGKGKIQITCPKCGERFVKKT